MSQVTIYHNPRCSKSRKTLELLEEQGIAPNIVLYLESPPDAATLKDLLAKLGLSPRELLRSGEDAYRENGLDNMSLGDEKLIEAMLAHPILIERPIVTSANRATIGRPPECVLDIL